MCVTLEGVCAYVRVPVPTVDVSAFEWPVEEGRPPAPTPSSVKGVPRTSVPSHKLLKDPQEPRLLG